MFAIRALIVVFFGLLSSLASAQTADPWKDWLSADSAHFRIHYRTEHRAQAEQAARAAERAYPRITKAMNWEPRGKTEIVLFNEFDLPNGYSTPLNHNVPAYSPATNSTTRNVSFVYTICMIMDHGLDFVTGSDRFGRPISEKIIICRTRKRKSFLIPNMFTL